MDMQPAVLSSTTMSTRRSVQLSTVTCVCWFIFHFSSVQAQNVSNDSGGYMSDEMFRTVWSGYQQAVRPLCGGYPSTVKVTLGIALRQIQELDEPKQILATNLWLRVAWFECRLTWNKTEWNVSRVIVPHSSIWTPDLTLYDNADASLSGVQSYRLSVTSEGSVGQQVPVVVRTLCQLDVSRFPFDTQTCNLTFGSWAYNGLELDVTQAEDKAVDMDSFVTHGEWKVSSLTAQRIEPVFFGVPYPQVIFTLVLQRRHLFYILSLLFPVALIQLMAALAFLLPCETNEKVGLEITVLLSLAVMQLVILDMIPASSETLPIIGIYFMLAMIVVALSCLMSVIVLAVHYPNRHRPLPPWSRAILDTRAAKWLGVDITTIQQTIKLHGGGNNSFSVTNPDVTVHTPRHNKNPQTNGGGEIEMSTVCHFNDDKSANSQHSHAATGFAANPSDVTNDSDVSFYYGVEGDRSTRVCYRPLSADAACGPGARPEFHLFPPRPESELKDVVDVCRKILDCMQSGKKHGDSHHEKISNKAARREWELMAKLLDRVFLLVFCLLTFVIFVFLYASIV